ncbi:hypothetical protein LY54_02391 [Salegentibacter mishustinae]|nr:hypothetical protein LY54_02391 [Salegentibacter mishustinae]
MELLPITRNELLKIEIRSQLLEENQLFKLSFIFTSRHSVFQIIHILA